MNNDITQQKSRLPAILIILAGIGAACIAAYFFLELRPRKLRALDIKCSHRVKDIAFAATIWAHDHQTNLPSEFSVLRDRFKRADIFNCPANGSQYELRHPGFVVRCRFHGHSDTAYQP